MIRVIYACWKAHSHIEKAPSRAAVEPYIKCPKCEEQMHVVSIIMEPGKTHDREAQR